MNPVVVEQEFETLLATLPLITSARTRLLKICDFLGPFVAESQSQFMAANARKRTTR